MGSAPNVAASVDSELSSTTTQPSSASFASLATIRPLPSGAVYSKPPETIFWPSGLTATLQISSLCPVKVKVSWPS